MFSPSLMGVAGAQQGIGDTIKDPYSSESSSVKSAFSNLALSLASAAGAIGITKLAQSSNTGVQVTGTGSVSAPVSIVSQQQAGNKTLLLIGGVVLGGIALIAGLRAVAR